MNIYLHLKIQLKYLSGKCSSPPAEKDSYPFLGTHMVPSIYYITL